jgi:hypothetical protein
MVIVFRSIHPGEWANRKKTDGQKWSRLFLGLFLGVLFGGFREIFQLECLLLLLDSRLAQSGAHGIIELQNQHFDPAKEFYQKTVKGIVYLFGDPGPRPAIEKTILLCRLLGDARQSAHHKIEYDAKREEYNDGQRKYHNKDEW